MNPQIDNYKFNHFFSVLREKKKSYEENYKYFAPKLAPKFSIFNFVRRDENALSYIIANLLDPMGEHEQGSVFIELFTGFLTHKMGDKPNENLKLIGESHKKAKCITESTTDNQRRIDIVIDFGNFGIGIENKPWAFDQKNQLRDYSEELKSRYGDDFLLVYLTGSNWDVSEYTISSNELAKLNQNGHFLQITYQDLKEWIVDCEAKCQADRVRNFLRDFADYCDIQFGNGIIMSDENLIKEYLLGNPANIELAFQIGKVLPKLKASALIKFREQLLNRFSHETSENGNQEWIIEPNPKFDSGSKIILLKKRDWQNHSIAILEEYGWNIGIRRQKNDIDYLPQEQIDEFKCILNGTIISHKKGWINSFLIYFNEPYKSWDANHEEIFKVHNGVSGIFDMIYDIVKSMDEIITNKKISM